MTRGVSAALDTQGQAARTLQYCLPNSAEGAVCVMSFAVCADQAMVGSRSRWEPCLFHALYQVRCILCSAILCCC